MAFELNIPKSFKDKGWKVKIRENERLEPPHVTVLFKKKTWRWDLRDKKFIDKEPPPKSVPNDLVSHIENNISELIDEWNKKYAHNPV